VHFHSQHVLEGSTSWQLSVVSPCHDIVYGTTVVASVDGRFLSFSCPTFPPYVPLLSSTASIVVVDVVSNETYAKVKRVLMLDLLFADSRASRWAGSIFTVQPPSRKCVCWAITSSSLGTCSRFCTGRSAFQSQAQPCGISGTLSLCLCLSVSRH
jgi:hypothetical protein